MAKTQVEKRREYVAEHPEEKAALEQLQASTRSVLEASAKALKPPTAPNSSSLADYTVAEAEELIAGIDDRAELAAIAAADERKGVKAAVDARLKALDAE